MAVEEYDREPAHQQPERAQKLVLRKIDRNKNKICREAEQIYRTRGKHLQYTIGGKPAAQQPEVEGKKLHTCQQEGGAVGPKLTPEAREEVDELEGACGSAGPCLHKQSLVVQRLERPFWYL